MGPTNGGSGRSLWVAAGSNDLVHGPRPWGREGLATGELLPNQTQLINIDGLLVLNQGLGFRGGCLVDRQKVGKGHGPGKIFEVDLGGFWQWLLPKDNPVEGEAPSQGHLVTVKVEECPRDGKGDLLPKIQGCWWQRRRRILRRTFGSSFSPPEFASRSRIARPPGFLLFAEAEESASKGLIPVGRQTKVISHSENVHQVFVGHPGKGIGYVGHRLGLGELLQTIVLGDTVLGESCPGMGLPGG